MSDEDDDDKQHEPSQKRLDDARKRGEIPKSNDLSTAASYAGFLIACLALGWPILEASGNSGRVLLEQSDRLSSIFFANASAPLLGTAMSFSLAIAPLFLFPIVAVIGSLLAQRAIHFAPEKLNFKVSRISPISNAKQKFGSDGIFEFVKSFAKMIVVGTILCIDLSRNATEILLSVQLETAHSMSLMLGLMRHFLFSITIVVLTFGGVDYLWQRRQHNQKNRMSRKEVQDEMKDSEGDQNAKSQRRQRGHEIATNQMLQDVKTADVIIVNPTHFAIALKWERKRQGAPICVAKGVDEIAARIREKAAEAGVPLHSDPPTARAIFASVEIGQQIKTEHFRAVAAAIRFSEAIRKRKKKYSHEA